MPEIIPNLWPTEFAEPSVLTPIAILRQQGLALGQRTQNIVVGTVSTEATREGFRQHFDVYCSPLGYQAPLLVVEHGIDLYPLTIELVGENGARLQANSPDDFTTHLRQVFASDRTRRIVGSLLAQSKQ